MLVRWWWRRLMWLQKLLYNSVLPTVRELTDSSDHLVIILPTLLALIANSTDDEYRLLLQPELRKVINMTRPVQVNSIFTCTGEFNLHRCVSCSADSLFNPVITHVLRLWSVLPVHQSGPLWKSLIALFSTLHFWNQLPTKLREPRHRLSPSRSPPITRGSSSSPSSLSPLSSSLTRSFFHSELKTWLFWQILSTINLFLTYRTDSTDSLPI